MVLLVTRMVVLSREEVNLIAQFLDIVEVSECCVGLAGQVRVVLEMRMCMLPQQQTCTSTLVSVTDMYDVYILYQHIEPHTNALGN